MPDPEPQGLQALMLRLALGLGVGLLIGIERGWQSRDAPDGSRVAGVRTFTLTGLLGGVIALLAATPSGRVELPAAVLLATGLVAVTAMTSAFSLVRARTTGSFSATTGVAAAVTFALGACAVLGDVRLTAAIAVTAAGVLTARSSLHAWVRRMTSAELQSTLLLLAMTCIALPVIPDRELGWLPGFNPREIWMIAIALAAASYAGYVCTRLLGARRGVLVAAGFAALVSSMAVILANARESTRREASVSLSLAACCLASAVSLIRVVLLSLFFAPSMVPLVAAPLIGSAIAFGGLSVLFSRADGTAAPASQVKNPFNLVSTLLIAGSLGVVVVAGTLAYRHLGRGGVLLSALVTGAFDVDSMTVAMSKLVQDGAAVNGAAFAVLGGTAMNLVTKTVAGVLIARGRFARGLILSTLLAVLVGGTIATLMGRWPSATT